MAQPNKFSGFFSQLTVVSLLALFLVISLAAMFTTAELRGEMEWVGMTVRPLGVEAAAARGLPPDTGVIVEGAEGIAARAGIRSGDVLMAINNHPIEDLTDFADVTAGIDVTRGGVQVDVLRGGFRIPIPIFASAAVNAAPPLQIAPGGVATAPTKFDQRWLGIEAETLLPAGGMEVGVPAGVAGVLVDTVKRGSKAESAGLMANDVIVAVNGQRVDSTLSLWHTLAGLNGSSQIELGFYRSGQLGSVTLPGAAGVQVGGFAGRMGDQGLGPGGMLVCPNCRTTIAHQRGVPCLTTTCPSCGSQMMRQQSPTAAGTPIGGFAGRMGGQGLGPGGTLVCPNCRTTIAHQPGVACLTTTCPACGTQMMRRQ